MYTFAIHLLGGMDEVMRPLAHAFRGGFALQCRQARNAVASGLLRFRIAPRASVMGLHGLLGREHRPQYPLREPSDLLARDRASLLASMVVRLAGEWNRYLLGALGIQHPGRGKESEDSTLARSMA